MAALEKLKSLHQHIEDSRLLMPERFNSWMEDGQLTPANKKLGAGQLLIGRLQYDAVLEFEGFSGNPAMLMAVVCIWLIDNDPTRDDDKLPQPDIDVDMEDDTRATVEIRVRFREDIELVEDSKGSLALGGQKWSLTTAGVVDVDTAAVGDDQEQPTDLPYTREP